MALSLAARAAAYAQGTGEVFVWLLLLDHDSSPPGLPVRLTTDVQNITSNGDIYTPFPMEIVLPGSQTQGGSARIVMDSVDETVRNELRALTTSPSLTISMVLRSAPDTIIQGPIVYELFDSEIDRLFISSSLVFRNAFREAYPGRFFNQATSPGVF